MDTPRTGLRRASRWPWIALAVVVAAGAVLVASWYREQRPAPAPAPQQQASAPADRPEEPTGPVPDADPARVKSLLESASPNPLYRRALGEGDLVRRWAVVTDNLAEGVSPRKQLGFLAPKGSFSVEARGGRTVIAAASYARYDEVADAVASLDAQVLARVYRELHRVVQGAYRALGYPGASLDAVTAKALHRLAAAPLPGGEVEVVDEGGIFTLADPRLEALGEVEKHLLRMGPRNGRLVQAKARELIEALGLPAAPERGARRQ